MHDAALQGGSGPSASAKRIYVGGIPFETREAELREFFEAVMQKGRGCKLLFWLSLLPFGQTAGLIKAVRQTGRECKAFILAFTVWLPTVELLISRLLRGSVAEEQGLSMC